MDIFETLIEETRVIISGEIVQNYGVNHLSGLRYRLRVVGGHDHPVCELGVQHTVGANMSKMKVVKNCKNCCCVNHCLLTGHKRNYVSFDHHEAAVEYKFPNMLDKCWNEFKDYEQDVLYTLPLVEDKLLSISGVLVGHDRVH